MQTPTLLSFAVAAALAAAAAPAMADDAFTFSGFGTLSAVRANTDDAQFRAGTLQPIGAGKDTEFGVDTKLGLQAQAKLSNDFSATVQVLSQRNQEDSFRPRVEWGFAKYQVTPEIAVRGGRMGLPLFLISDYRNVGYANTWARPPVDVYGQVAAGIFDGVDLIWKHNIGDGALSFQPVYGASKSDLPGGLSLNFRKLWGANLTYEWDSWLFRAGYVDTEMTGSSANLDFLVATMRSVPLPGWANATNALVIDHKDASFAGLGMTYDDGKFLVQSEYTQRRTKSFIDGTNGWYALLGYHYGNFTPYLNYGKVSTQTNHVTDAMVAPTPQLAGLKAAVVDAKAGADQHTISAGLRWNFYKNMDLKFQYDRVTTEAGKDNFLVNYKPNFTGRSLNVGTVALDFVF